ncbi:hypothetical protein EDD18DRAFT_1470076 [Armillaria luteobubalina]|uniref:Uncharacterized protein n=1 Tax=Armillaria luteobubalina TaxID=153913 RepID=A0AA39TAF6_9AGAR|nr:hypothetical protein EDD18DRAFT_1470076 [Armillaria luteobubalina]
MTPPPLKDNGDIASNLPSPRLWYLRPYNHLLIGRRSNSSHLQLLLKLHDFEASRSFVNFVIRTIIAIRFAQDYRSWPLSEKKKYHRSLFEKHYKTQIEQIGNQYVGRDRDQRLEKLFKEFKGQHEKVVTARNHLDRLYRIFGVTLLLDPFWQLAAGLEAPKHSRPFGKIVALLEQDMNTVIEKMKQVFRFQREMKDRFMRPEDEPLYEEVNEDAYELRGRITANQINNKKFLFDVIKALGGNEVYSIRMVEFATVKLMRLERAFTDFVFSILLTYGFALQSKLYTIKMS